MPFYPLITEKQTFFDANSNELSGGKLFIYQANTTTKVTTFAETDGLAANSNPIVLNSRGEVPNGLYVAGGIQYKLVLAPSTDTDPPTSPIWTRDDLNPLGYVSPTALSEWQSSGSTATQTGVNTFTVTGDARGVFQVGRRVRAVITAAPQLTHGTISVSSFGAGVTTVTLSPLTTNLDAGLTGTIPDVGLLSATEPSVPVLTDAVWQLADNLDRTKKYQKELSTITTGQTRTRTAYDKNGYETVANDIWGLHNVALGASVAGNNLTLSLLTNAGATPSASDPAFVGFRSASSPSGAPSIIAVTGATTFTITAGSTLGFTNGEAGRIWVCAINNAGTVELAAFRAWRRIAGPPEQTGWYAFNEQILSTTAEGTGTADSAQVLYSGTARVGVAMRYLGYVEIVYGTAAWSNAPTFVQTNHSRMPLPGDVVQRQYLSDGAYVGVAASIPNDDSIPQSGEGTQYLSLAISPTSALNAIAVDTRGLFTTNAAGEYLTMALFNGATDSIACSVSSQNGADPQMQTLFNQRIGGTTSAITYTVRAGTASVANATYFNGWGAARQRGGVMNSYIRLDEIFV
jgi:hypothetical protein